MSKKTILANILLEIVEIKLGLIKTQNCEEVSQEEVNKHLDEEYEE